uniref:Uncharacterized protein n=1 Tax=Anguilla anguilla TaxID=7936 RepID=A0A0E9Q5K5_ANGAN
MTAAASQHQNLHYKSYTAINSTRHSTMKGQP